MSALLASVDEKTCDWKCRAPECPEPSYIPCHPDLIALGGHEQQLDDQVDVHVDDGQYRAVN
jgi:hypothetical protein